MAKAALNRLIVNVLVASTILGQVGGSHAAEKYTLVCTISYLHWANELIKTEDFSTIITIEDGKVVEIDAYPCNDNLVDYQVTDAYFSFGCEHVLKDAMTQRSRVLISRDTGAFDYWVVGFHYSGDCRKREKQF